MLIKIGVRGVFLLGFLIPFLTVSCLPALEPGRPLLQYGLTAWTGGEGFPPVTVNDIVQARDGFLWMASNDGLIRYDGDRFFTFTSANSELPSNGISSLLQDDEGALWAGLSNGGACALKGHQWSCFGKKQGIPDGEVRAIAKDRDGGVWLGIVAHGLVHITHGKTVLLTHADGLPNANISYLTTSPDGVLWICTFDGGLIAYNNGVFRSITTPILPSNLVWRAALDTAGHIWIATFKGLVRLNGASDTHPRTFGDRDGLPSSNVTELFTDSHGQVWVSSNGGGISRLSGDRFTTLDTRDGLSDMTVTAIAEDTEGDLWIGTRSGLNRLRDQDFSTFGVRQGLSQDYVRTLIENRDQIWVGTLNHGIDQLSEDSLSVVSRGLHPSCSPLAMYRDTAGAVWLGCAGGSIQRIGPEGKSKSFNLKAPGQFVEVNAIAELGSGHIYAATFGLGLVEYRRGVWTRSTAIPKVRNFASLLGGADGLWAVSVDSGLFHILPNGVSEDLTPRLQGSRPIRLSRDHDGSVWVVLDHEIAHVDNGVLLKSDLADTPMRGATPLSIVDDHRNSYWITSSRGVYRFDRNDLRQIMAGLKPHNDAERYGFEDGVKAVDNVGFAQPTTLLDQRGRVSFVSSKGLIVADPAHLTPNALPPPTAIEQCLIDDRPSPACASDHVLQVPPDRHRIEIRFAALELKQPERTRVLYKLDGVDSSWIDAHGERSAFYTDIPPGKYRFHVKASNAAGIWNTTGPDLMVEQLPHYYQRIWFQALCFLFAVLLGSFLYKRHLDRIRKEIERVQIAVAREREAASKKRAEELSKLNSDLQQNLIYMAAGEKLESVTSSLLSSLIQQLHGQCGCVFLYEEDTEQLKRTFVSAGPPPAGSELASDPWHDFVQSFRVEEAPFWTDVTGSKQVLLIDCRNDADARSLWPTASEWSTRHGLPLLLLAPLIIGKLPLGVFCVYFQAESTKAQFTEDQLNIARSLASLASMALETQRLSLIARDAAIAAERVRLSEEMHDGVQQIFTAISFQLGGVTTLVKKSQPLESVLPQIERAAEISERGIQEVRRSIQALRDTEVMSGQDFIRALDLLCEAVDSEETHCTLKIQRDLDLQPSRILNELHRIAQEAVANAYKHASATEVILSFSFRNGKIHLTVTDNGTGFPVSQKSQSGVGMRTIRERSRRIAGDLHISSSPEGTTVEVSLPAALLTPDPTRATAESPSI